MNVTEQKSIAKTVLDKIKVLDYRAIVMNDDPNVLEYTKPYVIYLGDWDE